MKEYRAYEPPIMELVALDYDDVVTASGDVWSGPDYPGGSGSGGGVPFNPGDNWWDGP